jgi:hypothetical protein
LHPSAVAVVVARVRVSSVQWLHGGVKGVSGDEVDAGVRMSVRCVGARSSRESGQREAWLLLSRCIAVAAAVVGAAVRGVRLSVTQSKQCCLQCVCAYVCCNFLLLSLRGCVL